MRSLAVKDYFVVVVFATVFAWFYRGFYFTDPFFFSEYSGGGLLIALKLARIVLPLAALGIIVLFLAVRAGRVSLVSILILLITSGLGLLVLYVPASHFYYNLSSANRVAGYHPYLQLAPPTLTMKPLLPSDPKPFRIVFLGGSSTAWPDSKGVDWSTLVGEKLAQRYPEKSIEVYNQAREWYNSQHSLINYTVNVRQFRPDALVIMQAVNDLMINADFNWTSDGAFRGDYGHFYGPVTRLVKRKSLFAMLYEKFDAAWYFTPREIVSTSIFPGLSSFRRNIATIVDLAKLDGTKVVLISEPYLYKDKMTEEELSKLTMLNLFAVGPNQRWDLATVKSGMEQYNEALQSVASENAVAFYDLAAVVPKELRYIRDDVHYTDEAFHLLSDAVTESLAVALFGEIQ